jgi:hypothetical protein
MHSAYNFHCYTSVYCNRPVGSIPPRAIRKLVISVKFNPGKQRNKEIKLAWTKTCVSSSVQG